MREIFFILVVVLILLALTAFRYRRQLAAAHRIWQMLRGTATPGSFPINQASQQRPTNEPVPLIKCARCGTWTPLDRSIRLGQNVYYCSSNCLENKAIVK